MSLQRQRFLKSFIFHSSSCSSYIIEVKSMFGSLNWARVKATAQAINPLIGLITAPSAEGAVGCTGWVSPELFVWEMR